MADDMFKSLLGKSSTPGTSWGELAGMYFSKGSKKDNRARNILLASLFFNAKEASMQSKVLRQLEDLEDEQTNAIANRTYLFNEGLKKQTKYDEIQNRGVYKYYKDDAEAAFYDNEEYLQNKEFYDTAGLKEKEAWKQSWADDQYNEFLKTYDETAPRLTTVENFNKPLNDFFKAKKREITSPGNISLVHKAFGFLPGAKERDRQLQQKTIDTANAIGYDPKTATITPERKSFQEKMLAVPQNSQYNRIIVKDDIKIGTAQFDDIAKTEFDLGTNTAEYLAAFENFSKLDKEQQTVGTAIQNIKTAIIDKFSIASQNTIKAARADIDAYIALQDISIEQNSPEYNTLLKQNIRQKLGVRIPSEEILETATTIADLTATSLQIPEDERAAWIQTNLSTYIDEQVSAMRGIKSKSRIRQEVEQELAIDVALLSESSDINVMTSIQSVTIPQTMLMKKSKELQNFVNSLTDRDTGLASNFKAIENSPFEQEIYNLQKSIYRANITNSALNSLDIGFGLMSRTEEDEEESSLPAGYSGNIPSNVFND